jgi:2',3'-cyclic-nucleotide 2'-phosphodiesterase (5'-nucleotidase family)
LDGRITRNGDGDDLYEAGEVVPLTILHHNDSHGRLLKSGTFQGYSQLVTLIKQERAHNPDRTLLLTSGDNVQGDSMMYYFKSAGLGYAAEL